MRARIWQGKLEFIARDIADAYSARQIDTGGISLTSEWRTRRERIALLLHDHDFSPSEMARILEVPVNIILEDLKHISRSRKYGELMILPARCRKCGYEFKREIKIPKRCPKCKSSWIDEPRFMLRD